jgi:hypothetical protein
MMALAFVLFLGLFALYVDWRVNLSTDRSEKRIRR